MNHGKEVRRVVTKGELMRWFGLFPWPSITCSACCILLMDNAHVHSRLLFQRSNLTVYFAAVVLFSTFLVQDWRNVLMELPELTLLWWRMFLDQKNFFCPFILVLLLPPIGLHADHSGTFWISTRLRFVTGWMMVINSNISKKHKPENSLRFPTGESCQKRKHGLRIIGFGLTLCS